MAHIIRGALLLIAFVFTALIFSLSREIFPQNFLNGAIRGLLAIGFLSFVWNATKRLVTSDEVVADIQIGSVSTGGLVQESSQSPASGNPSRNNTSEESVGIQSQNGNRYKKHIIWFLILVILTTGFYVWFQAPRALPENVQGEVTGNARIKSSPSFSEPDDYTFTGSLYNGSEWTLTHVIFDLYIEEKDGREEYSREYALDIEIPPFTSKSFSIPITITRAQSVGDLQWALSPSGHP